MKKLFSAIALLTVLSITTACSNGSATVNSVNVEPSFSVSGQAVNKNVSAKFTTDNEKDYYNIHSVEEINYYRWYGRKYKNINGQGQFVRFV